MAEHLPLISSLDLRPTQRDAAMMESINAAREADVFGSPEHWQMVHKKPQAEVPATPQAPVKLEHGVFHPIDAFKVRLDARRAARGK